jgi:hypothetical protein
MAANKNTAVEIGNAIAMLNRLRKPILKQINARGFELIGAKAWALSSRAQGLNIAVHSLQQVQERYLTT